MNDEQSSSGKNVNPAADVHAPRQETMPPVASPPPEVPVTEAPSESSPVPVSDELAEQMAEDATSPPVESHPQTPPPDTASDQPQVAETPVEAKELPTGTPSAAIQNELNNTLAAAEVPQLPKAPNPARNAVIIAVVLTVALSILAVFAFISSQK